MVTLLLVPRLRASFGQAVWQPQKHPLLSTRASGSKSQPLLCARSARESVTVSCHQSFSWANTTGFVLKGGTGQLCLGCVERHLWRLDWEQEPGQESPWWVLRATAALHLHHRGALEQPALSWSNCCALIHSQNLKTLWGAFCNMHLGSKARVPEIPVPSTP